MKNIDYDDLKKLEFRLERLVIRERFIEVVYAAADLALRRAQALCPVDADEYTDKDGDHPGLLLAGLRVDVSHEVEGGERIYTITMSNSVRYAIYNEYGWYGIPPVPEPPDYTFYKHGYRPFMRIGMYAAEQYLREHLLKECIKNY